MTDYPCLQDTLKLPVGDGRGKELVILMTAGYIHLYLDSTEILQDYYTQVM
jgi:hypothetical protein